MLAPSSLQLQGESLVLCTGIYTFESTGQQDEELLLNSPGEVSRARHTQIMTSA